MNYTNTSEFLVSVRRDISGVMKRVDEFIDKLDKQIKDKENELDIQLKAFSTLETRESKLKEAKKELAAEQNAINKQKQANRDKQLALEKREEEIDKKLERVKNILT